MPPLPVSPTLPIQSEATSESPRKEVAASSAKIWIAVLGSNLGAFMAVLNIQIVNASLADIQGAIGAGLDDGGWVSTAYLIAEIVVIPLSAWLSRAFSVRLYLLVNAALFLAFSASCAFAHSLGEMIVLRACQGFTGGVLIPMAFTIIITLLPKAKQPVGLALFALSATFAPAIGPTIGGYLTENWGWQYIFYVNLVPGVLMLGMLWVSLGRTPLQLGLLRQGDWPGIATMAIGLAALQTVLEEGNKDDWFGSPFILRLSLISAVALGLFVLIELTAAKPLLNLRLLFRRNFGFGVLANFLLGTALYGSVYILPVYLSRVQGYNAEQIGAVLAWTGLPQLVLIPLVPQLMKRFDPRLIIGVGFGLFAISNFMNIDLSRDVAADQLLWPNVVRAVGQALLLAPLSAVATAGIAGECRVRVGAVQHAAQSRRRGRHRRAADLFDPARAVPLEHADGFGLALCRKHPHPDRRTHPLFSRPRRRRSRRRLAPGDCRDRSHGAPAILHPRLRRHVLPARCRADRRAHCRPAAEETGAPRSRRRALNCNPFTNGGRL